MESYTYKGFTALVQYEPRTGTYHGDILEAEEHTPFQADSPAMAQAVFRRLVDQGVPRRAEGDG